MEARPFSLTVRAIIRDPQDRCLLLRRAPESKHHAGKWEFPGGKVDPGETIETALKREVAEETGLAITVEAVAGAAQHDMPAVRVVVLFMEAKLSSASVRLGGEHDAYRWLPLDEVAERDLSPEVQPFSSVARGRSRRV